jgi:hypothetical protein
MTDQKNTNEDARQDQTAVQDGVVQGNQGEVDIHAPAGFGYGDPLPGEPRRGEPGEAPNTSDKPVEKPTR